MREKDELSDEDLVGYAEEFKVEPGAGPTQSSGPGGANGLLAMLVERPMRNGGLALLIGLALAGLSVASALNGGFYIPIVLYISCAAAAAGLCVAVIPPPERAHEMLMEGEHGGDRFQFWKLTVLCFTVVGGGLGVALRVWLS
jgi:hypothetical protein